MKLQVKKRTAAKKSEINTIRREGDIPAVVYIRGKEGETISVSGNDFSSLVRQIVPGRLSTTVFELADGSDSFKAILKDITYDPVTYRVIHLDFEKLSAEPVKVKVPIEISGAVDSVGIKLGGIPRQVLRNVQVRCLPKDIPTHFNIDIRSMGINEVKRISDLSLPESVKPMAKHDEVAFVIGKR